MSIIYHVMKSYTILKGDILYGKTSSEKSRKVRILRLLY